MKFQAHPLVVAAALGLIGPGAIGDEGDDEGLEEREPGHLARLDGPPDGLGVQTDPQSVAVDVTGGTDWTWSPGSVPDAEAFQRVELAWKETVGQS